MKFNKLFPALLLVLLANIAVKAQTKALTETGRKVVLFDNGTWKYDNDSTANNGLSDSIKVNSVKFFKTSGAVFKVKSKVNNSAIYIDPNKWTFSSHHDNEVNPEYRFSSKSHSGLAFWGTEKTQIALDEMPEIALTNARKASYDARLVKKEYRMVNNLKILYLELAGTIKGIDFRYVGYYYSDKSGVTQLVCYTSQKLYQGVRNDFEDFLNGFVSDE